MKKNTFISIACLSIVLLLASCDFFEKNLLEEQTFDRIAGYADSNDGADQAVTGVYSKLLNDMFRWDHFPAIFNYDDDYVTGPDWALRYLGAGNFHSGNYDYSTDPLWDHAYMLIYRANAAIEAIEPMTEADAVHKANCIGELKFLKALGYFWLVRAYGDIPIHYKTTTQGSSYNQPRQPIATAYQHIVELLLDAEKSCYKNTESQYRTGHISAGAAASLLAKVYLTMASGSAPDQYAQIQVKGGPAKNGSTFTNPQPNLFASHHVQGYDFPQSTTDLFTLARNKALQVIEGEFGNYDLHTYADLWSIAGRNRVEHIFELQPLSGDDSYGLRISWYYTGTEDASGTIIDGLIIGCRDHWYKLFEDQDLRIVDGVMHRFIDKNYHESWNGGGFYPNNKEWSIKARGYYIENGDTIYSDPITGQPYVKDKMFDDGRNYICDMEGTADEYTAHLMKYYYASDRTKIRSDVPFPVLRYADVLLVFAEADNEISASPSAQALAALNKVRVRSKATPATASLSKNDFRSFLLEERAREFALEGDRRWDLIRWGLYVEVMNAIGNDECNVDKHRSSKHLLYPIPEIEISTNTAITSNNPGW